jgi:hypothetical protein
MELVVAADPGWQELAARRQEFARLADLLAERELELADLQTALTRFQSRYYHAVGSKYVLLDELQARLAKRRSERYPEDEDFLRQAWYRRHHADRSARQYEEFRSATADEREQPLEKEASPDTEEEAKRLYRMIAVLVHPDRAGEDTLRAARTAVMAELNAAYARRDVARMRAILEEWRSSPESVEGNGNGAELQRLTRSIARMERRIAAVEADTARLLASEMGRLQTLVREGAVRGRDLLADLAAELDRKIEQVRRELDELS